MESPCLFFIFIGAELGIEKGGTMGRVFLKLTQGFLTQKSVFWKFNCLNLLQKNEECGKPQRCGNRRLMLLE